MAKIHKVEMYMVDVNEDFKTTEEIIDYFEEGKYSPILKVYKKECKDFEWEDELIINKTKATKEDFDTFFNELNGD